VQCKGFKVQELGADQYRQIEASIQAFIDSDVTASIYLVVHNRDNSDKDRVARVEQLLAEAVSRGKATKALLWPRQRIVTEAFDRMTELLVVALRTRSTEIAKTASRLFRFGSAYVEQVPLSKRKITFRRDEPCEISSVAAGISRARETLDQASGTNWTILTGQFGLGKTTTALAAAVASKRPVVLVICAAVPSKVFTDGSTNGFTRHIVNTLAPLDDLCDQDRDLLMPMAASVLSYLLREPKSPFVFILDGLDEHHFFATLSGLQRLSNQLAEFSSPVVLTTRREHLETMLGDFNVAFGELGTKFSAVREALALYLEPWDTQQALELVDAVVEACTGDERLRVVRLREMIADGSSAPLYGDLVHHPLFLRFIIEDVVERGTTAADRCALIQRWVERKLRRDRPRASVGPVEGRVQVDPMMDTEEFVARMSGAMGRIAYEMSELGTSEEIQLLETLPANRVVAVVEEVLGVRDVKILPVLLNSVLTPLGPRRGDRLDVGFALRILQEFFAASYLVTNAIDASKWPASVREFVNEIRTAAQS
jgi:hypothetical protein